MSKRSLSDQPALPVDVDAEQCVLGSILLDRNAILTVASWLTPDHFSLERHAHIYRAMLTCTDQRTPPDLITVSGELKRLKHFDAIGGTAYLIELANRVPTAVHIEHYGRLVERTALHRRVIQAGSDITKLGFDQSLEPATLLATTSELVLAIAQQHADHGFVPAEQIVETLYANFAESSGELVGMETGFTDFDRMTGGLQKSDLLYLAARPSVGKTSLALNIAQHLAQDGRTVGIFSLEMSREQLIQRLLSSRTGIDVKALRTGRCSTHDLKLVMDALGAISRLPIYIDDTAAATLAHVRAKARRLQADHGLDVIMLDYIQLMQGSGRKNDNRVQDISEISRGLKALARDLNVPVLALSQLSRAVESRTSHVPMLSDLRDSGSLEQDADLVLFLYREDMYDPNTDKRGIAELHIAKHRNGPTGVVPLRFERSTTTFQNLATARNYCTVEGY